MLGSHIWKRYQTSRHIRRSSGGALPLASPGKSVRLINFGGFRENNVGFFAPLVRCHVVFIAVSAPSPAGPGGKWSEPPDPCGSVHGPYPGEFLRPHDGGNQLRVRGWPLWRTGSKP